MDCDGWHKSMDQAASICCSSTLNIQVIFYDDHGSHFDDREFIILRSRHIHSFILKAGDYVYDKQNNNGTNLKLNNLYGNARMNWMSKHVTLKFTIAHINSIIVETWEYLKTPSTTITQEYFKKTHLPPLSLAD